ncbi:MAG: hypothetical protein NTU88_11015, partial [Armatimonadetes bacterium]|nr:hypothetical protein [Armatimonadota bacterium]
VNLLQERTLPAIGLDSCRTTHQRHGLRPPKGRLEYTQSRPESRKPKRTGEYRLLRGVRTTGRVYSASASGVNLWTANQPEHLEVGAQCEPGQTADS